MFAKFVHLFLILALAIGISSAAIVVDHLKHEKISSSINFVLEEFRDKFNFTMDEKLPDVKSGVANVCPDSINSRLGCCQPTDVRHLNNVKIQKGKFLVFTGQNGHKKKTSIPNIVSVHTRQRITFSAEIEEVSEDFKPSVCKEYFNGTLHVIGRVTAHNVYHTSEY